MGHIKNSTLQRKTPLKVKTPLKAKTSLRVSYAEKIKNSKKMVYKYKPKSVNRKKYFSIFTKDFTRCVITGSTIDTAEIHIHHIFSGSRTALSEKYGFLIPLRSDWHSGKNYSIHNDRGLELKYKIKCEEYYLEHYGTKEQFIKEFDKWWLPEQKSA